jgi:hypothetical protein
MRTNWFSSRPIHRPKNSLLATKFLRQLKHRNNRATMSALGQKQTLDWPKLMSALPPKADIAERLWDVEYSETVKKYPNPPAPNITQFKNGRG